LDRGNLANHTAESRRGCSAAINKFHNPAAQFDHVDFAGMTPQDSATGGGDHAVGQRSGTFRIDSGHRIEGTVSETAISFHESGEMESQGKSSTSTENIH
jgi:hypothetical protein